MTDKEKIEHIMLDKQLNNTQFSSMIGISAGALSHITSGRSNPTLNILRSIKDAFPDLNPQWLFYDEGEMYLPGMAATPADGPVSDPASMRPADDIRQERTFQPDLFGMQPAAATTQHQPQPGAGSPVQQSRAAVAQPGGMLSPADMKEIVKATAEMVDIRQIVEQSVAQTVDHLRQNQRKIIEVRVFFDDGTFESFSHS